MWFVFALLSLPAEGRELYRYTAPDGTVVLTDTPQHAGFEVWWRDPVPGKFLPNGVPMPRLDRISNLDAYDGSIVAAASEFGVPAELIKAVAVAESRMNPRAVSHAGAQGLMQIIPSTQRELGVTNPFDPEQSIRGGAAYLADQVRRFGSFELAAAAYNAGPLAVSRAGGVPAFSETRTYVSRVMGLYQHFRDNAPVSR